MSIDAKTELLHSVHRGRAGAPAGASFGAKMGADGRKSQGHVCQQ